MTDPRPIVLIYRRELLPLSNSFILNQARHLTRYRPVLVGSERVPGTETGGIEVAHRSETRLAYHLRNWGVLPSQALITELRSLRPALMHAHFGPDGVRALPLALALGIPLVTTLHGYDATIPRRWRWWRTPRDLAISRFMLTRHRLFANSARILCVSDFIRACAVSIGVPSAKAHTHHIGIDLPEREPAWDEPRSNEILFVGRLVAKKGLATLLQAIAALANDPRCPTLLVAGYGPLEGLVRQAVARHPHRVRLLGPLPNPAIRELMTRVAGVVAPSEEGPDGDCEGLPTVLLEAAASGCPMISSRHAGAPELITDGESGRLFPERDHRALTQLLLDLSTSRLVSMTMARRAWMVLRERFDIRRQCLALETHYDDCITNAAAYRKHL